VPGLEVRVPLEGGAAETGLVVDPALVDVDVRAQDLAGDPGDPVVADELREERREPVDVEDRAHLLGAPLPDHALVAEERRVGQDVVEFGLGRGELGGLHELLEGGEAVEFVGVELRRRERPVLGPAPHGGVLGAVDQARLPEAPRRVEVGGGGLFGNGVGGHEFAPHCAAPGRRARPFGGAP
jgi:hypothetical protein